MTTVVNIKDCPSNWMDDASYVFIGRPSDYGNRHRRLCFVCNRAHDRYEAVKLHAAETRARYQSEPAYRALLERLRGKKLVCHCKRSDGVDVPCHGDVYAELLEER